MNVLKKKNLVLEMLKIFVPNYLQMTNRRVFPLRVTLVSKMIDEIFIGHIAVIEIFIGQILVASG